MECIFYLLHPCPLVLQAPFHKHHPLLPAGENEDEDGELTYENVSPAQGGLSKLASSGPGDKAGMRCCDRIWSQVLGKVEVQREWLVLGVEGEVLGEEDLEVDLRG